MSDHFIVFFEFSRRVGLTVLGSGDKVHRVALLFGEQPVVGAEPRPVLRVRAWIVRQAAEAHVPADGGQVAARGVDDVEHFLLANGRMSDAGGGFERACERDSPGRRRA